MLLVLIKEIFAIFFRYFFSQYIDLLSAISVSLDNFVVSNSVYLIIVILTLYIYVLSFSNLTKLQNMLLKYHTIVLRLCVEYSV